jgi:hypothetical protein
LNRNGKNSQEIGQVMQKNTHSHYAYIAAPIVTALLAVGQLQAAPAFAQGTSEACALDGLSDARAKRVCEVAAEASAAAKANRPVARDESNDNWIRTSSLAPLVSAAVSGGQLPIASNTQSVSPLTDGSPYPVLANVLDVAIQGTYPPNYKPSWGTIIGTSSPVTFDYETIRQSSGGRSGSGANEVSIGLYKVDDSMVLGFDYGVISQLCMADVVGLRKVIGREVQNFELQNFRVGLVRNGSRSRIGDPCTSANVDPIYSGRGTIRSDADGNLFLAINMQLQNINRYNRSNSSYQLREVRIANNMTPTMAVADLVSKTRIAQETATREAEQRRVAVLVAGYDARFPAARARIAASPPYTVRTIMTYKGYNLKNQIELSHASTQNTCNQRSIQWDIIDYYNQSINLLLDAPLISAVSAISRAEPHEKDAKFAAYYVITNKWNEAAIDLAARLSLCDPYGTKTALERLRTVSGDNREGNYSPEIRAVREYLEKQRAN